MRRPLPSRPVLLVLALAPSALYAQRPRADAAGRRRLSRPRRPSCRSRPMRASSWSRSRRSDRRVRRAGGEAEGRRRQDRRRDRQAADAEPQGVQDRRGRCRRQRALRDRCSTRRSRTPSTSCLRCCRRCMTPDELRAPETQEFFKKAAARVRGRLQQAEPDAGQASRAQRPRPDEGRERLRALASFRSLDRACFRTSGSAPRRSAAASSGADRPAA